MHLGGDTEGDHRVSWKPTLRDWAKCPTWRREASRASGRDSKAKTHWALFTGASTHTHTHTHTHTNTHTHTHTHTRAAPKARQRKVNWSSYKASGPSLHAPAPLTPHHGKSRDLGLTGHGRESTWGHRRDPVPGQPGGNSDSNSWRLPKWCPRSSPDFWWQRLYHSPPWMPAEKSHGSHAPPQGSFRQSESRRGWGRRWAARDKGALALRQTGKGPLWWMPGVLSTSPGAPAQSKQTLWLHPVLIIVSLGWPGPETRLNQGLRLSEAHEATRAARCTSACAEAAFA